MKELKRYERALQIALGRMGVNGVAYVDGVGAVAALFEDCEEGAAGEVGRQRVRDVYRVLNTLEELERQAGVRHVMLRNRPQDSLARLEAMGYEVRIYPEIGPRDGEISWIGMAFYEGRLVAHAYGHTREQALQGLVGEVGI